jgi:hypothetical protein
MRTIIKAILFSVTLIPAVLTAQTGLLPLLPGDRHDPVSCEAVFTFEQDSTDLLVFNFTDQSTGDITDYYWNFGDGSTGSGPVVSHSFPEPGQYTVCLTISNSDTANFCSDSACVIIDLDPQPSYLLGGLLYAGNFPINNPFNTNDFGYAFLYRIQDAVIMPVDTVHFDTLGYFYFTGVPAGDYLLKAGMKPNSSHFNSYLPGYYQTKSGWSQADTLHVTTDFFMAHVHMNPLKQVPPGSHSAGGYVMIDDELAPISRVVECEVILCDSAGDPVKVTYTDPSGVFRFDLLSPGTYNLRAEFTGLYSDIVQVTVHDLQPAPDSIEIKLHHSPQGIDPHGDPLSFHVNIFPNPASDELNLDIRADRNMEMHYELINSMGIPLLRDDLRLVSGMTRQRVGIDLCPPGIYVLIFSDIQSGDRISMKVIVR